MLTKRSVHARYKNKEGVALPSVTTIISLLNKPALIHWAWNLGLQGEDYHKVTDKAAEIGTIAHYMVKCFFEGTEPQLGDFTFSNIKAARIAFDNFKQWWMQQQLELVASELSLVSERMQCGGTLDCIARKQDDLWLIDIKTSAAVYNDMLYQLAAYWAIWNENYPDQSITSAHIIQLGKGDDRFAHYNYDKLSTELEVFRHLRVIYDLCRNEEPSLTLSL